MPTVTIHLDTHGLDKALKKKGSEVDTRVERFKTDILNMAKNIVQRRAPRGKTGKLKASVQKDDNGIFISKNIAPYRDFVIDGRRGFCRKGNTYMGVDIGDPRYLRFMINGKLIFTRCVGPAKPQPFVDDAFPEVESGVQRQLASFESWLGSL